jgi:hypothetical protein
MNKTEDIYKDYKFSTARSMYKPVSMAKPTSLTKKEVRLDLGISKTTMHNWLNIKYYDELVKVGYVKNNNILIPAVLNVLWLKIYGFPYISEEEVC